MKRPNTWLRWLLVVCVVLGLGECVALTVFAPRHVIRAVERAAGGELSIGRARLSFPFTTRLNELRLITNTAEAGLTIQRAVIRPRWLSLPQRTLWVDSLEIDRPFLRLTRTKDGTIRWPSLPQTASSSWRIRLGSLRIIEGIVDFIDRKPASPFRAALAHVSIDLGPVILPQSGAQMTFAVRGEVAGAQGSVAPVYCSGWVDPAAKNLEASCRLEPLALAALEPYSHGPSEVRVFGTTIKLTSQWLAKANDFKGRIQFELGNLRDGGLSVKGRTIIDARSFTAEQEARTGGEITVTGPLDNPSEWHAAFLPGDEQAQQLVKRLLDRGVEVIKVPLWGTSMRVSLAPASKAAMTDIEATSKEVQEALEVLAVPEPTAPTEPPASEASPMPPETSTPPPGELPAVPAAGLSVVPGTAQPGAASSP